MKLKLMILLLSLAGVCKGQTLLSFVRPMGKPVNYFRDRVQLALPTTDSNVFRPIASVASYTVPGNILMTGIGFGYQHNTFDYTTGKWYTLYSFNAMVYAGGSLSPKTPADIISEGLTIGFLNNLIMVGAVYNGSRILGVISLGVSLNN